MERRTKMKAEIKTRLLKRLRDPKQERCVGKLKEGQCMCVGGILCDLYNPLGWRKNAFATPTADSYFILPTEVREWSGLDEEELTKITQLNDCNPTWKELIAYLEAPDAHRI